jgi:hypothetical protein
MGFQRDRRIPVPWHLKRHDDYHALNSPARLLGSCRASVPKTRKPKLLLPWIAGLLLYKGEGVVPYISTETRTTHHAGESSLPSTHQRLLFVLSLLVISPKIEHLDSK